MSIFKAQLSSGESIAVKVNGAEVRVPLGASAASAVLLSGISFSRTSPVDHSPRAPYCMMGVCFECLMTINGVRERQGCMVSAVSGMTIECEGTSGDANERV